jgi:hypothetical protein
MIAKKYRRRTPITNAWHHLGLPRTNMLIQRIQKALAQALQAG